MLFAYSSLDSVKDENTMNRRLIELLGNEMNDIFSSSKLIMMRKDENFNKLKERVKEVLLKKYREKKISKFSLMKN